VKFKSGRLSEGVLVCRYKRFLADIETNESTFTAHCPNTGAMTGCAEPGSRVGYSLSENPKRKYPATLEVVEVAPNILVGVNPGFANAIVEEGIMENKIESLSGYQNIKREAAIPSGSGRFDFCLTSEKDTCYVEVKSVTLAAGDGLGLFPDAVSTRAAKHVRELVKCVERGERGVLLFCVQHSSVTKVATADEIDPSYGEEVRKAVSLGVEVIAYSCDISFDGITLDRQLPFYPGKVPNTS